MSSKRKRLHEDCLLVWTEKNGQQRVPRVSFDQDAFAGEDALVVPEHHAKLAGRMLEALEAIASPLLPDVPPDVRQIASAIVDEARAQGGSDE